MDFSLSPDQILFRDSVDRFFADTFAEDSKRDAAADWRAIADMGLTAAPFPEDFGGTDATAIDMMFVAAACGRTLTVAPVIPRLILAGHLLRACANAPHASEFIEEVATGAKRVGFAQLHSGGVSADGKINGESRLVLGAGDVDAFLVASPDKTSLALAPRNGQGIAVSPFTTIDGRGAADLRFANVAAISILASGVEAESIIEAAGRRARAAWCAEGSGAMRAALDQTLDYVRTRKQFGRPIGSFQALQHRLVDMRIACELTDTMARVASMAVDEAEPAEAERLVAVASAQAVSAARLVAEEAIQMHGGMGMTDECSIGKYVKRLLAISALLGSEDESVDRFLKSA